jgi:crotonobetainyl-CoA:carnitine CoA-transferase CaiB-like acyl-CoA transferase
MSRPTPLDGIRIVDLTQVLAGPYCTYQLALLGAQVIKVEPPGGELTRFGGPIPELNDQGLGLGFCTQNADKDCVEADLKDPDAVDRVLQLIRDADVFVQNYRPGVAERLGFGVAALQAINPRLVYCSISAYGEVGPIGHRPAYDHVVQAMSGIMQTTGTDEMGPVKVGAPYIDYATGLNAAFAVMAALRELDRTGKPQVVDVAMLDTALNLMANNLVSTATTGREMPKLGNEAASRAPSSGCYATADGSLIMLAANNERQFRNLVKVLGSEEWADDERWSDPATRRKNQDALRKKINEAFLSRTAPEWEAALDGAGVPASCVRSIGQVIEEGQPDARGLLTDMTVGSGDTPVRLPGIGFRINGDSMNPRRAPHGPGEDDGKWLG